MLSEHTVALYRYLWTHQADRRRWDLGAPCMAGVLFLVGSLCVTAWTWFQDRLGRHGTRAGALQRRRGGRRLGALCTILLLLTLFAVSGPHLVHHLADSSPPDDHHTPTGPAPPPPDCLVFFVMQHTPVAAGVWVHSLIPLVAGEPVVCASSLWISAAPKYLVQARAPPYGFSSRTVSM
jgi:hypothetical protein